MAKDVALHAPGLGKKLPTKKKRLPSARGETKIRGKKRGTKGKSWATPHSLGDKKGVD